MGAECSGCHWDLPYDGECVVCDGSGVTYQKQVATLRRALKDALDRKYLSRARRILIQTEPRA